MKEFYVYALTNKTSTVIYIGVTKDLNVRLIQHSNNLNPSFVKKYKTYKLIYFERYTSIVSAIGREKQLKRWHKDWKWNLVKSMNPDLKDISDFI